MAERRLVQSRLGTITADFFTVGYEKMALKDLFRLLQDSGVCALVDVREAPWSRVPEYRKEALEEGLIALGRGNSYDIEYVSMPGLGNPSENRHSDRPTAEAMAYYKRHVLTKTRELESLRDQILKKKSALVLRAELLGPAIGDQRRMPHVPVLRRSVFRSQAMRHPVRSSAIREAISRAGCSSGPGDVPSFLKPTHWHCRTGRCFCIIAIFRA
jgi:hypothetical protein